jgi:hypothetical protein
MMSLMQSMVPTQEPPRSLSALGLAQTIRTDGATEWKHVFQTSPHSKNKFNPGRMFHLCKPPVERTTQEW